MECKACRIEYAEDSPRDSAMHRRVHNEIVNGTRWAHSNKETVVGRLGQQGRIVLVTPRSTAFLRDRAWKVGNLANKETHFTCGVMDSDGTALIGILNDRAVTMLVLEPKPSVCLMSWADWDAHIPFRWQSAAPPKLGCTFLWTIPAQRGNGWAKGMANAALAYASTNREIFPWGPPFTDSGEAFVRKYSPDKFSLGWG